MLPVTSSIFFFAEILETINELNFVVRVIVFSYLLFWLYMTLRDLQLMFGLSSILAGYFVFAHGLSVTLIVLIFVVFVLFGSHLQMLIQFGIMPLLGYHFLGDRFAKQKDIEREQHEAQQAQIQQTRYARTADEQENAVQFQQYMQMRRMT